MLFNTNHIRTHLDKKIEFDEKIYQNSFSLPISLRRFLEANFELKSEFRCPSASNHHDYKLKSTRIGLLTFETLFVMKISI